jgi:hypothetical protein
MWTLRTKFHLCVLWEIHKAYTEQTRNMIFTDKLSFTDQPLTYNL